MAKRAAILIGVDKTGDLPRLRDAAAGARAMEVWAREQKMATTLLTDEAGPVTVDQIKRAIKAHVEAANIGQLLVYFAGHGVNLQRQEYWLLSDAPDDTQAAVNVATSVALAATCGIPHVLLFSDACRTAPEGVRAQSVRGSEIFPNREADMAPVDQFFACQLGRPSHEVKDPNVTAAEFKALYTNELVPALLGQRAGIVDWSGGGGAGHVHLRPLRDHMAAAMAARIAGMQLQTQLIQVPVAQISSDPPLWVSQVEAPAPPRPAPPPRDGGELLGGGGGPAPVTRGRGPVPVGAPIPEPAMDALIPGDNAPPPGTPASVEMLRETLGGAAAAPVTRGRRRSARATAVAREAEHLAQPFGPTHHETACGFKLRGMRAVELVAAVKTERADGDGRDWRIYVGQRPGNLVLAVLDTGAGVLLPAIPEFMAALSFDDDGELADVAYEPSANTWRWGEYEQRAGEIRRLRAIAAAAMSEGSFQLEGGDALAVARSMQLAKGVDPSLAVYAAYAYFDLQRRDLLRQMHDYLRSDLGAALFDVALLARALDRQRIGSGHAPPVLGAAPLLSQGWALLRAFEVQLTPTLAALEAHRLPSLWTMFDAVGVERIRGAFTTGELK